MVLASYPIYFANGYDVSSEERESHRQRQYTRHKDGHCDSHYPYKKKKQNEVKSQSANLSPTGTAVNLGNQRFKGREVLIHSIDLNPKRNTKK